MLLPSTYYHIYNHANGYDNLYREQENYHFFLQQYDKFISPIADTFAYCLMPNHFHFLVCIKDEKEIIVAPTFPKLKTLEKLDDKEINLSPFLSKQFANFFSSYTQAFNKRYNRQGSLFLKNFKHKAVANESYLINLIAYIHLNPVHHGFVSDWKDWKWTSYGALLSSLPSKLSREAMLRLFGNAQNFSNFHEDCNLLFVEYNKIENDILT